MPSQRTRKTNRDLIYADILDKIQYCTWPPGMLISDTALSESFGVSKMPVREALSLLARDGYVDIYPQSGSYVSKIDLKKVKEIIYLRNTTEKSVLVELAAKKEPVPSSVKRILRLAEYAVQEKNWVESVQQDYTFHKALFDLAGHAELWEIIERVLPHYTRLRFFSEEFHIEFMESPRDLGASNTLEEHRQLVEAIETGDVGKVRKIVDLQHDYNFRKQYKREIMKKYYNFFTRFDSLS